LTLYTRSLDCRIIKTILKTANIKKPIHIDFSIQEGGDLPKGLYCYVITSGSNISNILQIYAKNKNNSIILSWDAEGGSEFDIFRGTDPEHFDGFFTVYSDENSCLICDNGLGILNESKTDPWL
jgi:hypothetical protein